MGMVQVTSLSPSLPLTLSLSFSPFIHLNSDAIKMQLRRLDELSAVI